MNTRRTLILGALSALSLSAVPVAFAGADGAQAQLAAFLKNTAGATGRFTQVTVDRDGRETVSPSAGHFAFLRPGRFEWVYDTPYVQKIISNGKKLWIYDPDLFQVTEKVLTDALPSTPAAILFGSNDIEKDWTLTGLDSTNVRAVPRQGGAGFESVTFGFSAGGELASMKLLDTFGQTTTLEFSEIRRATPEAGGFEFKAPEGTDIIRDFSGT